MAPNQTLQPAPSWLVSAFIMIKIPTEFVPRTGEIKANILDIRGRTRTRSQDKGSCYRLADLFCASSSFGDAFNRRWNRGASGRLWKPVGYHRAQFILLPTQSWLRQFGANRVGISRASGLVSEWERRNDLCLDR